MAQTGFTPISIYYSSTAAATPTAGNLVAGELAINTADGKLFYKDSAGVVQVIGTKGGVGSSTTTQVLYNSSGLVVGSANLTFNGTTLTVANDASISGLTVGKGGGAVVSNSAFGQGALNNAGTGNYVTAIGYQSLYSNTTGQGGTAVGGYALYSNTTGTANTGIGGFVATGSIQPALFNNTTGSYNIAVGTGALASNTTASNNTAVGYQAGYTNTTATRNAILGYQAGYSSNSNDCTFVGFQAGYTTNVYGANTYIGSSAGYAGSTGASYNVAVGYNALTTNSSGGNNTAIGTQALNSNTSASNNTAVGYQALYTKTTGDNNTAIGYQAGYGITTGVRNTALGRFALNGAVTGEDNVGVGNGALYSMTSGNFNTALGSGAGNAITTGTKNTIIGAYSGNQGGLDIRTASNYIVLSDGDGNPRQVIDSSGNWIVGNASAGNQNANNINFVPSSGQGYVGHVNGTGSGTAYWIFGYNGTGIGSITQTGTTAVLYNTTSDYRLKTNATPIQNALAIVKALNPVSFTWVDGRKDDGFLAHEIQSVIPNCVTGEKDAIDEYGNPVYQQMDNSGVIPFLVKAIQELNAKLEAQALEIAALKVK